MRPAMERTLETLVPQVVALRRELHAHPEIRFEETWTSDRIAAWLDACGASYQRGYAKGTGIVGEIAGDPNGPTIALRADIDALEIDEQTGLSYASTIPGRMHACGHDGHTAILCGLVKAFQAHREALPGTIRFIFQPAEEVAAGGRFIVEEGAVDGCAAAFALHGWPTVPLGKISIKSGCAMARAQDFEIVVSGKGAHAADPASGVDPVLVAAHITTAFQSIVAREIDPWNCGVVSVTQMNAGTVTNIIPETCTMRGTFRALDEETGERIYAAMERIARGVAEAFRATIAIRCTNVAYPAVFNDPAMTELVRETATAVLGEDGVIMAENPVMGAEDFSYYLQRVPGAFIWLGVNPSDTERYPNLHNPRYNFNDDAIPFALRLMANVALDAMEKAAPVHA